MQGLEFTAVYFFLAGSVFKNGWSKNPRTCRKILREGEQLWLIETELKVAAGETKTKMQFGPFITVISHRHKTRRHFCLLGP